MARRPRIHFSGAVYHAMARGVNGVDIYRDDQDRRVFLEILSRIALEASCEIIAYCLMSNHFHLAAQVNRIPLSSVMHRVLTAYVTYFNRRYERMGHLFQARYEANLCLDDKYLATLIPYIHMNPVRADLVASPQDWPWSSYAGEEINPADLLNFDLWPNKTEERIDLTRREDDDVISLDDLAASEAEKAGIPIDDLRSRSRLPLFVEKRREFAKKAVRAGYSQTAVAKWLHSTRSSISRYVRKTYATTGGLTPKTSA